MTQRIFWEKTPRSGLKSRRPEAQPRPGRGRWLLPQECGLAPRPTSHAAAVEGQKPLSKQKVKENAENGNC